MKTLIIFAIICCFSAFALRNDTALKLMMNQMEILIDGPGSQFDPAYYNKLVGHMSDRILESQNRAWQSFINYFDSNGTATDHWGSCQGFPTCFLYMDHHPRRLQYHRIIIYQPCNFVSNVAYYHVFTSIADHKNWNIDSRSIQALEESFCTLTFGSSFYHASFTYVSNAADNNLIGVIFYTLHQASLVNLDVPLFVQELTETPRSKSAIQTSQDLINLFISKPPSQWIHPLNHLDIPFYFLTIPCVVILIFTLTIPDKIVDAFLGPAMTQFLVAQKFQTFILSKYVPALRKATSHLLISTSARIKLLFQLVAAMCKMIFSFVFQEWMLPAPFFKEPWVNAIGALLMPTFNQLMTIFTGFHHTDFNLENSINVYPGDATCRVEQPHSKWHEESASMLLDLILIVDHIIELTE